ncbi:MAG: Internalin-A [Candidatus Anoxychlamydiales bacterium]|nr:Internalin-A [Candidatus Anoxychlamydiales bacterium]
MTSPVSKSIPSLFQDLLPKEDKLKIFSYLDIPDLTSVSYLSNGFKELANDQSIWSDIINRIGLNHSKYETVSEIKAKIEKIHELGKLYFPPSAEEATPFYFFRKPKVIKKPITIENTKETLRKINEEIKIKDTLKVWQKVYEKADPIAGKPAIDIPKFDELKESTDKKAIKASFADWINNNKDNFNLTRLYLSNLQLNYLPKEIGSLAQLQELGLGRNNLTFIPKEIWSLAQLQELSLSDNNLTSIPEEIGNLTQLRELYLWNNNLTSILKEIGNLSQLHDLDLASNKLTSIPKEIGNLSQLQTLYLSGNKLTSIPKEIGNLSQLEGLSLSNNKLTSISGEIGNLSQLQWLSLSNNKLTSIPGEIGNLSQLHRLDLRNNSISYFPTCLDRLTNTNIFIEKHILITHKIIRFTGDIAHYLYNKIYGPITE